MDASPVRQIGSFVIVGRIAFFTSEWLKIVMAQVVHDQVRAALAEGTPADLMTPILMQALVVTLHPMGLRVLHFDFAVGVCR